MDDLLPDSFFVRETSCDPCVECKTISMDEVKSKAKEAWIVIDGYVYDLSKFLNEHPGGSEILMEHAGTDASKAFKDKGHSKKAIDMLPKYKIGKLDTFKKMDKCSEC